MIWLFPRLIHPKAKGIQSHVHAQNKYYCCPSYVTKARHLSSSHPLKQAMHGQESKLPGMRDREQLKKQIVSYTCDLQ